MDVSIRTVAMLVLAIMVVSLVFMGFSGWFEGMAENFVENVNYPSP